MLGTLHSKGLFPQGDVVMLHKHECAHEKLNLSDFERIVVQQVYHQLCASHREGTVGMDQHQEVVDSML